MPAEAIDALHATRFAQGETARSMFRRLGELQEQEHSLRKDKAALQSELRMIHVDRERMKKKIHSLTREIAGLRENILHLEREVDRLTAEVQFWAANSASKQKPLPPDLVRADKVYKRLATKYHPDRNAAGAEFMKDLHELWQELKALRR